MSLLGAPPREATVDDLVRLNALARERGYRRTATDDELAELVEGSRAMGRPFEGEGDVLAATWMVVPPDVLADPIVHLLIDVAAADFHALEEWEERPLQPPGDDAEHERAWPVFAVGLLVAAAIVLVATSVLGGDPVAVGGWIVAAGGLLVVLGIVFVVLQVWRGDHWDALDEFFASLEGLFAIAGGVGLVVVGALVIVGGLLT